MILQKNVRIYNILIYCLRWLSYRGCLVLLVHSPTPLCRYSVQSRDAPNASSIVTPQTARTRQPSLNILFYVSCQPMTETRRKHTLPMLCIQITCYDIIIKWFHCICWSASSALNRLDICLVVRNVCVWVSGLWHYQTHH